jgi:hypothetical protein
MFAALFEKSREVLLFSGLDLSRDGCYLVADAQAKGNSWTMESQGGR